MAVHIRSCRQRVQSASHQSVWKTLDVRLRLKTLEIGIEESLSLTLIHPYVNTMDQRRQLLPAIEFTAPYKPQAKPTSSTYMSSSPADKKRMIAFHLRNCEENLDGPWRRDGGTFGGARVEGNRHSHGVDPGQGSRSTCRDRESCVAVEEYQSDSGTYDAQGDLAGDAPAAAIFRVFWCRPYRGGSEARREGDDPA